MTVTAKSYQVLSCLKLFLVIFTVLFLCTGVIFLATGIYSQIALTHYSELSPMLNLSVVPPIFCGVGGFIILSGLFGFVAAIKNNRYMVNFYCCMLSFVFILEVLAGIGAIFFLSNFKGSFKAGFVSAVNAPPTNKRPTAIDKAQAELHCCGAHSYEDWYFTTWANSSTQCEDVLTLVPSSCCKIEENSNSTTPSGGVCFCGDEMDKEKIYTKGCLDALFGSNGETLYYLLGSAFGCALIQLISIIISSCIFFKLKQLKKSRRY